MKKHKCLVVFGTRPEAIKLAPVIEELKYYKHIETIVCNTGQHRGILDEVLKLFKIEPDIDLEIMTPNQGLAYLTDCVLQGIDSVLATERPDIVIVQGDTTSAFAAALAAFYRQIPIAHVEAGLRTYNKYSPFPEEMNRVFIDKVSALCFAPTAKAGGRLWNEAVNAEVTVTGNTVVDAVLKIAHCQTPGKLNERELFQLRPTVLVTAHRRESFGKGIRSICRAIKQLAEYRPGTTFIFPVHPNPSVVVDVERELKGIKNVRLIEPLNYFEFVHLMKRTTLLLTDSGGVQEEACTLDIPVLIMRDVTERPEVIDAGAGLLVGVDERSIVYNTMKVLESQEIQHAMTQAVNPFGNGEAAKLVVSKIFHYLEKA